MQHNCNKHKCSTKDTKIICQEQEDTETLVPAVHHKNLNDLVLNCSQMRSAMHFEHFRVAVPSLDREWAIHQGAAREIHTRLEKGKRKTKARGQNNSAAGGQSRAATRISDLSNESQPPATSSQNISNCRTSGPSNLLRNLFASRMESRSLPLEAATHSPTFNPYMHQNIGQSAPSFPAYYGVRDFGAAPSTHTPISSSQFSNPSGIASGSFYQGNGLGP